MSGYFEQLSPAARQAFLHHRAGPYIAGDKGETPEQGFRLFANWHAYRRLSRDKFVHVFGEDDADDAMLLVRTMNEEQERLTDAWLKLGGTR